MPAHPLMKTMHGIYGRDGYQGEHLPNVADPIQPAKLLDYQPIGRAIVATINKAGTIHHLHLEHAGHPELMLLGDADRNTLQGALMAMAREVGDAA